MEEENKKGFNWVGLIIVGGVISIVLFFIFQSNVGSQLSPTGKVIYTNSQKECQEIETSYEEQEEYFKTEYYTETVPYQKEIDLKYTSARDSEYECRPNSFWNYELCWDIKVENLDIIGGIFEVKCNFETLNREFSDIQNMYIKPGNIETLKCISDVDMGEDIRMTYIVTPPTKTITDYKEVQREKQVTAYRPVIKYKTETICN